MGLFVNKIIVREKMGLFEYESGKGQGILMHILNTNPG